MTTYRTQLFSVAELLRMESADSLNIQPRFQRRAVWPSSAKPYLIDTILRGVPMPKIYLRDTRHPETGKAVFEVVDGQQRMRALIDFDAGELSLAEEYSPTYGGMRIYDLPAQIQRKFHEYQITADVMEDSSEDDVWRLFARLNRFTVALNKQELRHAQYAGRFKILSYDLAESHLPQFQRMGILSQRQIDRMRDAELSSDILTALVVGISDTSQLDNMYREYDSEFPEDKRAGSLFSEAFDHADSELGDAIRTTRFHNHTWFYSLLVSIADAIGGIPHGMGPRQLNNPGLTAEYMLEMDGLLREQNLKEDMQLLLQSLLRSTGHVSERKTRHEFFFHMVTR